MPMKFLGEENEWLVLYAKKLETKHYNYFGHRHLPMVLNVLRKFGIRKSWRLIAILLMAF
jgi:hypothetical protein